MKLFANKLMEQHEVDGDAISLVTDDGTVDEYTGKVSIKLGL